MIDPNILISLIIEESEHRNRKETWNLRSKQKAHDGDEALAVAPGGFSSWGKGTGGMDDVGEAPQGLLASMALVGTVDQETTLSLDAPNLIDQRNNSVNAATFDSEEEGAFSMVAWGDLDDKFSIPDLLSESSDGNDKERWSYVPSKEELFSEMGDTDDGENLPPDDDTSSDISAQTSPDLTNLVHDSQISTPVVKLSDSSSTWHISPYKDQFMSLTSIPPKMFLAANKQSFNAIATGDLIINMPNGCDVTKLRLIE
ncbi:hypothetical protein SCLCIDRAFT_29463 [Scleroderma citrinum Foug A]|uniref:Uncharacterized protein n=1 Tax=Scleroderma citrinum Foug A TaxID=1036808 RepID=A0A0C3DKP7_9AGAM|nr:hypothetical protein SCLCIDRAFT_29463 [Scleroderma citrinum Foug A]